MNIEKRIIAHFSPTGETQKVTAAFIAERSIVRSIAAGRPKTEVETLCPSSALPAPIVAGAAQMFSEKATGYKKPAIFL